MKNLVFTALLVSAFICAAQAQSRFKPGLKAGVSTTQVDGDTYGGFDKAGFVGGATLNGKINEKFAAQFEILFIQKGSKHVGDAAKGDISFYLLHLNYVEVPVLIQYTQKKFTFELGPSIAYLINSREYDTYGEVYNAIPFYSTDLSASLGLSYQIYKKFSINWRFTNSLLPIRRFASGASTFDKPGQRNVVLAFTINYKFGEADEK